MAAPGPVHEDREEGRSGPRHRPVSKGPILAGCTRLGVACMICAPTVYVCLLPLLAADSIQFALRCEGFPKCTSSSTGVSVGEFVATPQATGALAAVFFWPCFRMWSLKVVAGEDRPNWTLFLALLGFYVSFGLILVLPVTKLPLLHNSMQVVSNAWGWMFFAFRLRPAHGRRRLCAVVILAFFAVAILAHLVVLCIGAASSEKGGPDIVEEAAPWLRYGLEVVITACLSLLPWSFDKGHVPQLRTTLVESTPYMEELRSSPSPETFVVLHRSCFPKCAMLLLAAAMPVYVWLLPLLAMESLGFAHRCPGLPRCEDSPVGMSVSSYIASPQATGAMGLVSFWPLAHLWTHKKDMGVQLHTLLALMAFYIFFGLFLATPVTVYPTAHAVVVAAFCLWGLIYYVGLLRYCTNSNLHCCLSLLQVSIAAFVGVIIVNLVAFSGNIFGHPDIVLVNAPWLFYGFEATGLSTMALFPWFWRVEVAQGDQMQ
mmetsp:Transcript_23740/g.68530  ORF Transcript_23740/g.68530 Transcript_23740/m.68530 type:complete len:486 (+) Transcript_23740:190-1647(+)